jgi:hypothetical protein
MRRTLLLVLPALLACRRGTDAAGVQADASPGGAAADAGAVARPALAPSRCTATGAGVTVPDAVDLDLGDAVAFGEGYAVGLAHRTASGRTAAVALVSKDPGSPRLVELGPTLGDAPAPHLAVRGPELVAAWYALPGRSDSRELRVQLVGAHGESRALPSVQQQKDDSLAFDVAGTIAVWDETSTGGSPRAPRGTIRVAELSADHAGTAHDVSPAESDAEMPRLVRWGSGGAGGGYLVLWLARRPEAPIIPDAASPGEATGEARTPSWLEAMPLDAAGAPAGPLRRLTPTTGHVSAYDVLASRDSKPAALVIARDDGESIDGSGGSLLRVRVTEQGTDPPLALAGDGLGRGSPMLVDAPLPWLAWAGPHEELRLLPLDASGVPLALPSAEPALGESRPLLGGPEGMVVAVPSDAKSQLQVVSCRP